MIVKKMTSKKNIMNVNGNEIVVVSLNWDDFISLTDIMKSIDGNQKIEKWMSNRTTIDFLGTWESMHNENFDFEKFLDIRDDSWNHTFTMSVSKWRELTKAKGIISQTWKFWWTYAHKDIALEFATWLSPQFKLYILKEFQRLKEEENEKKELGRDIKRFIVKANYRIHTDAIQAHIAQKTKNIWKQRTIYAEEAEMLNMAVFKMTSADRAKQNPSQAKLGNIRESASVEQLTVLSNLEVLNAQMIKDWLSQEERERKLTEIADTQLATFWKLQSMKQLRNSESKKSNIKELWVINKKD